MLDFHALYQSYAPQVHRFALFLCGDATLADDITSESFVRAWTARGKIREATVKAYLFTIARNLYRDHLRRSNRLTELEESLPDPAAGLASRCQIQISYAIGVARPTSVMVTTFGTGKLGDEKLAALVQKHFDLRPRGIVKMLRLLRPIYGKTAAYGHFGRSEPEFTWERTDKAATLRAASR